jgi:hypothetical protein
MADKSGEILTHIEYIRDGIDGINARLDALNGRTRKVEQDVAVLHDRADQAVASLSANKATAVKWGAGFGAAIAALIAGLSQAFGAK